MREIGEMEERPTNPSIAALREIVFPPEVRNRRAEHWTGTLYMRRVSVYFTWLVVRTPMTANHVTGLMVLVGFLAGPALLLPGLWGPLVAFLLAQFQMYLDCVDGEVARWRSTFGAKGIFLDAVGHYVAEGSIALFLGVRVANSFRAEGNQGDWYRYVAIGALFMAGVWMNKALNALVAVARLRAGFGDIPESTVARRPSPASFVGRLRSLARFVPMHRLYHSIELTMVTLAVSLIAAFSGLGMTLERWYVVVMTVSVWVVTVGHFLAIWKSSRLEA